MSEFECELQELLIEIDMLIEKKKCDWQKDLHALEKKLAVKVKENNRLQDLVGEKEKDLQKAIMRLNLLESKHSNTDCEKQIEELSCKIDAMKSSYTNLQRKYQKQLIAEKSDFSTHLQNLEKENEALKSDYERLRQKNEQTISSLRQQLVEEKNCILSIQRRCDELQSQLESKAKEEVNQKSTTEELEKQHKLTIDGLEKQLEEQKHTIKLQAEELMIAKTTLKNKTSEIHRLSHEAELKKTDLINSQKSVKRLEKTVARHLNLLLNQKQNSASTSPCKSTGVISPTDSSSILPRHSEQPSEDQEEINQKVRYLENQLNEANNALIEKMLEISRLENTCQTASATIRRLVESKAYSTGQTKSLEASIHEACERVENFEGQLMIVEKELSSKLSKSMSEISRLRKIVQEIQSFKQHAKNQTVNVGVQTTEDLIPEGGRGGGGESLKAAMNKRNGDNESTTTNNSLYSNESLLRQIEALHQERTSLRSCVSQQLSSIRKLQQENLALSDLLTNAEQFNRTHLSCATNLTSTPSINYLSSNDGQYESLHCFKGVNNNNMVADERSNNSEVDETISQITKSRSNSRGEFRSSNMNSPTAVSSTNDVAPGKNVKSELMTMNEIFRRSGQAKSIDSSSKLSEATRKLVPPLRLSASPSPTALVKVADCNRNSSNGNEMTNSHQSENVTSYERVLSTKTPPPVTETQNLFNTNKLSAGALQNTYRLNSPEDSNAQSIRIVATTVPHFSVTSKHNTSFIDSHIHPQSYQLNNGLNLSQLSNEDNSLNHCPYNSTILKSLSSSIQSTSPLQPPPPPSLSHGLYSSNFNNSKVNHINLHIGRGGDDDGNHENGEEEEYDNDGEEDTEVYNLAAKFLADEQKHSALLEEQIDAHLKDLKEYAATLNGFC
ncbi:unnamed protein product [Trichobilharzia szidati]|nr:unnamed protein product [Trichobilharzia szidati]